MNLMLQIDRAAEEPLQDQLYDQLRGLIAAGKLKPNARVIATRFLAEQICVSRTTVLLAYERLISEGYLETRPAIGTFVSRNPPSGAVAATAKAGYAAVPRQGIVLAGEHDIDFRLASNGGEYCVEPKVRLREIREVLSRHPDIFNARDAIIGSYSLRNNLCDHLAASRGIQTMPELVLITSGNRQACSLIAHLVQRAGDRVVVESPGNEELDALFRTRNARICEVPVDEEGLMTQLLPEGPAVLCHVTPARQNPSGAILPQARRAALVEWAHQSRAYILEDDSRIEPHYHGFLPPPIATIDPHHRTFYIGALAPVLGAVGGMGFVIAPPGMVERMRDLKTAMEARTSLLEQAIVGTALETGVYDQHLRRFRKMLLEKRDLLIRGLRAHFGEARFLGAECGTGLTWLLPDRFASARAFCELAAIHGIHVEPVLGEPASPLCDRAVIFGYAALSLEQIRGGIGRLADALST
jgi:GntR family transcriptional regulator/MocR family aminotransferase